MAKIDIEKKPRRPLLPLLLALVVIVLAVVGIYLYLDRDDPTTVETAPGVLPPVRPDTTIRDTLIPPTGLIVPDAAGAQSFQLLFWPRGPENRTLVRI